MSFFRILFFLFCSLWMTFQLTACGGGGSTAPVIPWNQPNSLVLMYHFDESTGSTAINSQGNFLSGAISGASRVPGKLGQGLMFGQTGGNIDVDRTSHLGAPLELESGTFSLDLWVKPDALDAGAIYTLVDNDWFIFLINDGQLELLIRNGIIWQTALLGTQSLAVGVWQHIALIVDGTTMKFYINGVEDSSVVTTYTFTPNYNNWNIGSYYNHNTFKYELTYQGTIDEFRFHNYALTGIEISDYFQQTQ
jgi:Concanavalin A-like lectin/glucanases superfamily